VKTMCQILRVSKSGYFAWCKRKPSHRQVENKQLVEQIHQAYVRGRQVYGNPRVHAELRAQAIVCGKHRVERLMRQANLRTAHQRRRTCTTDSLHGDPVAPNLLQHDFAAPAPNRKWLTDITAIVTTEGYLYLAVVLDVYSQLIVGWAMASHREESLVEEAMRMALGRRNSVEDLLHHSDRGSQYTGLAYQAMRLVQFHIQVSMSRKGNCYDHAMMESFFRSFKMECVDLQAYQSRSEASLSVFK